MDPPGTLQGHFNRERASACTRMWRVCASREVEMSTRNKRNLGLALIAVAGSLYVLMRCGGAWS
jgi:hypothetical protein